MPRPRKKQESADTNNTPGVLWWEIIECEYFSSSEKLVLLTLARYGDKNGRDCYPSSTTIASKTGLKRNTVFAALKALKEDKVILIREQKAGRVVHYTINRKRICALTNLAKEAGKSQKKEKVLEHVAS